MQRMPVPERKSTEWWMNTICFAALFVEQQEKFFFFFVEEAQQAQRHRNKWFKKQSSRLENKSPFTDLLSNWSGGYFFIWILMNQH